VADRQLMDFRASNPPAGSLLDTGVWSVVRNPNYLGEIGFWWGLWLMALGGSWVNLWTAVGPLAITALFVMISIPLKEARMAERRGELWTAYVARTPALLPRRR
jgi:steroid 5-alpha reductase family enzyme